MTTYNMNLTLHTIAVPAVVDIVDIGALYSEVTIFNRSATDPLFIRMDGVDPSINGADSRLVMVRTSRTFNNPNPTATQARIISPGAAGYSVEVG